MASTSSNKALKYKLMVKLLEPTCLYCETELKGEDLTLDHIVPKKHGGTNHVSNLELSCYDCNYDKGHMLLTQYLRAYEIKVTKRIAKYL